MEGAAVTSRTKTVHRAGQQHGIRIAERSASLVAAGRVADTREACAAVLVRQLAQSARDLRARGMSDHLVRVWTDAAIEAGTVRLREFLHFLNAPSSRSRH